nr:hypothetical protein [uncultured Moellerella sp.]
MKIFNDASWWYRPLWQSTLLIGLFLLVILICYYLFFWQENSTHTLQLQQKTQQVYKAIHQHTAQIEQLATLEQLNEKKIKITDSTPNNSSNSITFITQLRAPLEQSGVVIKNWYLVAQVENQYKIEITGNYFEIISFLELALQAIPIMTLDELHIIPTNKTLLGLLTFTVFKDENNQ